MKTLCVHQLRHVVGGASSNSGPIGCPDCDERFAQQDNGGAANQGFTDTPPGWGGAIGSIVGGRAGSIGAAAGLIAGHYIETRDYNQIGENYKNQIDREIKNGNIPAD